MVKVTTTRPELVTGIRLTTRYKATTVSWIDTETGNGDHDHQDSVLPVTVFLTSRSDFQVCKKSQNSVKKNCKLTIELLDMYEDYKQSGSVVEVGNRDLYSAWETSEGKPCTTRLASAKSFRISHFFSPAFHSVSKFV